MLRPGQHEQITQSVGGSSGASDPTLASGTFDQVRGLPGAWAGTQVSGGPADPYPTASGGYTRAGATFTVTGSGDISPAVPGDGFAVSIAHTLIGTFAGLLAVVVVAALFMTAEYRRGLISITFSASPRRGVAAMVRSSAIAVTTVIVVIILPYLLATFGTSVFTQWLLRIMPAAGFAIQQAYSRYPQVDASYTIVGGYYPLAPWAGFAVLCTWAAAALALAAVLLRWRDA